MQARTAKGTLRTTIMNHVASMNGTGTKIDDKGGATGAEGSRR